MQHLETIGVLVTESLAWQHSEDLLGGESTRPLHQLVGDSRPSVRESIERILRAVRDELFFGQREQLGVRERGHEKRHRAGAGEQNACTHHLCSSLRLEGLPNLRFSEWSRSTVSPAYTQQ